MKDDFQKKSKQVIIIIQNSEIKHFSISDSRIKSVTF